MSKSPRKSDVKSLHAVKSTGNLNSPSTSAYSIGLALNSQRISETVSTNPQFAEQERQISALSSEIRSKERSLALLNARFPSESEPLLSQLHDRDQHIEELTAQLRDVSAQLAVSGIESMTSKEKQIAQLQEDKIRLFRDLQHAEEQFALLQGELREKEKSIEEEKENIELVEEALTEENAALKAEIKRKDEQLKSMRGDVLQLSKIVGEMSKLNTDLNEKILVLNGQMEKTNAAAYEHQARAKQTDDIEQAYNQLRNDFLAVQKREKKLADELARLSELTAASLRCQEKLKTLEDSLPTEAKAVFLAIQEIRHELKVQTVVKEARNENIFTLKQQLNELTEAYKAQTLELQKTKIVHESAAKLAQSFEAEKQRIQEQYEESLERLGLKGKVTADIYEKLREKVESLTDELTKADANLQKSMTKLVSLQGQVDLLRNEKRKNSQFEETKNKQIHELKAQALTLRSQKVAQETAIAARENRLRKTAAEMKVFIDEIWKKDTEIQKLKKIISKTVQSTEETHSRADIRLQAAVQLTTNTEEIEKRDREIELFRGMLRSTQIQLKTSETELQRLKRKYESDPVREGKPVVVPARDLSPARLVGKLDTEVRKIEELVEVRRQVQGGAVLPIDTLRRVLLMEETPRDKGKLEKLITARANEIYETLAKWAHLKFKEGLHRSAHSDHVSSSLLTDLLQTTPTLDISTLLEHLQELIHTPPPSKPRRKAA